MLRFAVLLQTLTHTALCCCLYFQGFFMMTLCDNSVMKICRAVCSSCFYVFGTCLFSCCVSEVFFLLYFLFFFLLLILGKRSVKKVSHVPRAREGSCLQAHFAFLSGGLSQDGAFVWKRFSTSRAGSASRERRGFQARADPSIATWNRLEMSDRWGSSNDLIWRIFGPAGSQFAPPSFSCHGPALGVL